MPYVKNLLETLEARGPRGFYKTQRQADRKPKPQMHRFDENKIEAAHRAYLKEKEETRMNSNQYGYAGRLRRAEG